MKTIGIVGCGAIGKALIQAAEAGKLSVRIENDVLLALVRAARYRGHGATNDAASFVCVRPPQQDDHHGHHYSRHPEDALEEVHHSEAGSPLSVLASTT